MTEQQRIEKEAKQFASDKIAEASVIEGYIAGATAEHELGQFYKREYERLERCAIADLKTIERLSEQLKEERNKAIERCQNYILDLSCGGETSFDGKFISEQLEYLKTKS